MGIGLLLCVITGFAAAACVPALHRVRPGSAGPVSALVPAGISIYLLYALPSVVAGEAVRFAVTWAPGVQLAFRLDGLSLFFSLLVSSVAVLVFVYSTSYMRGEEHAGRFYAFMLIFMSSMLGLVLADDVLVLYVFFEATSLSSFLLIGLDADQDARRASRQALIVTNAGGLALLVGLLLLSGAGESGAVTDLLERGDTVRDAPTYTAILLLVVAAACAKSAQIPFHFWLPNAMTAPTPVSAFLHSAAMVKAGIYLLARFSPVLGGTPLWEAVVTAVGGCTMLAAAWLALREVDLKRLLAYSTAMALGMMIMLLGLGTEEAVKACLIYVVAHACYKAALFMTTGAIQHATGVRAVDELAGLGRRLPAVFGAAVLAGLSMAGVLPLIGAIGKEHIYSALLDEHGTVRLVLTSAAVLANIALVAAAGVAALRPFTGTETSRVHEKPARGLWFAPAILGVAGLLFGLFPNAMAQPVLSGAASAIVGHHVDVHLELWSGFTSQFRLAVVTLAAGAALYLVLARLRSAVPMRLLDATLGRSPDAAYDLTGRVLRAGSTAVTRRLQNGKLRRYLLVLFLTAVVLIAAGIPSGTVGLQTIDVSDVRLHEWLLGVSILLAAFAAVRVRSRLGIVLVLSTVSYGIALFYLLLGAPDVAMTQVLVETLLTVFVVLAFVDLPKLHTRSGRGRQVRDAFIAGAVGILVTTGMLLVVHQPFENPIGEYYALNAYVQAHGRNVVNVILTDFRALDTLGEITVLGVAGLGSYALLRYRRTRSGQRHRDPEAIT